MTNLWKRHANSQTGGKAIKSKANALKPEGSGEQISVGKMRKESLLGNPGILQKRSRESGRAGNRNEKVPRLTGQVIHENQIGSAPCLTEKKEKAVT